MMLALGLPAFSRFQREQDLITAAQTIRDAILETQNLALAPRSDESGQGKVPGADYYRIVFDYDGAYPRYQIEEQANATTDLNQVMWQSQPIRQGLLSAQIIYEDTPPVDFGPGQYADQIIFSISKLGKVVYPVTYGNYHIHIIHRSRQTPVTLCIQAETGQMNIVDGEPPCI